MHNMLGSFGITVPAAGLEKEIECLRKEKHQRSHTGERAKGRRGAEDEKPAADW